jgi:Zn-dependent peptidase ImmA (M78 family)
MYKQKRELIEQRTEELLRSSGTCRVPVPIERVAQYLNLITTATALGDDISGLLLVENKKAVIGYNSMHAPVRQRFTLAHEIGHFVLHVKGSSQSRLFIDKYVVYRRDQQSSKGDDQEEVEANAFAAALLMPARLVRSEIKRHDLDLDDEDDLCVLANRFDVSTSAMSNRLVNLELLR